MPSKQRKRWRHSSNSAPSNCTTPFFFSQLFPQNNQNPPCSSHSIAKVTATASFLGTLSPPLLLRLSSRHHDVDLAKAVHASLLKHHELTHLSTALISTYINLNLLSYAYSVFLSLSSPNVVSYSALISTFSKSHREIQAIRLFLHWQQLVEY